MQKKLNSRNTIVDCHEERLDDVINFILEASKRRTSNVPFFISFYGGEPLLAFDKIAYIINALHDDDSFFFTMTTNGKILSPNIVRFMNEHKVHVLVSWDGAMSAKKRGFDAVREKWDLMKKLDYVGFSSVVTKDARISDRLEEISRLGEEYRQERDRLLDRNIISMVKGAGEGKGYSVESYRKDLQELFGKTKRTELSYVEQEYVYDLVYRLKDFMNGTYHVLEEANCLKGTMISVFTDGSISSCINTDDKVATIDMPMKNIISAVRASNETPQAKKCMKCKYAALFGVSPSCKIDEMLCSGNPCETCKAFGDAIIDEAMSVFQAREGDK